LLRDVSPAEAGSGSYTSPGRGPEGPLYHFCMPTDEHITHSAEETIALGRELASTLKAVRLVLLRGDLGAGKTTLVKGIAEGLETAKQDDVTSPTFTLVHEYRGPEIAVYHIDLYRIETLRELETLGIDELLAEPGNLVLVEWGEKFPRFEKERDVEIRIERRTDQVRRIVVMR
jgi:tRNA threonylcarbamoyladenosine biosynthesis protein TsaE